MGNIGNSRIPESIAALEKIGISRPDAVALRRIAMTLHRWHEMECGEGNDYASWCITRGRKTVAVVDGCNSRGFEHDEDGAPFIERHAHDMVDATYVAIPDRERGAKRRLQALIAKYPALSAYVQGDPRGVALYILRPGDVPEGAEIDSYYSRGAAVYK